MKVCKTCGEENTNDSLFCCNCGSAAFVFKEEVACPKCGAAITERAKGYMCENRTCSFSLWKTGGILKDAEKPLTSGDVKELLEKGCVRKTGLRSAKTHTKYDATLHQIGRAHV